MALSSEIPLAMRRRLGRSVVIYADVELRAHRKKGGHGMCHRSSMDNHTLSMYIDHRYQIAWVATSREQAMKNAGV